jgi:predicted amidohydrolase YtcJ
MPHSSLAIINANVITLNPDQPRAEAILVECERTAAVGSNSEIRRQAGAGTEIIDAKSKTVVPGLVDCHVHMTAFGFSLQEVDLRDADSIGQLKQRVRDYAEGHRERPWVLGGRWDQERFAEKRYPTRWDLDEIVSDRPVFLMRVCGHVAVVNSKALHLAGIKKDTPVEGGSIDLDKATGEPSGILRENALELIWRTVPKRGSKEFEEACLVACRKAVENGLTCVHWMVTSRAEIEALQTLQTEGRLPLRICLSIDIRLADHLTSLGLLSGFGNDMLKLGFVKILADGSLGGRTAALSEAYSDKPDTKGMMLYTQRKLNSLVSKVHSAGLQLAIHAIGDRAIDSVLKAYEKALEESPHRDHRHRIEHCSVLNPKLISHMKRLSLIASVQPHFVVSDFWAEDRVGKARGRWMFPFKTLMKEGLVLASGSDCPVENISPILGIWAAAARKNVPEEALTAEEALKTYTMNAAYSSFEEQIHGSIEVGKLADFTVLSEDLLSISPDRIRDVSVEMTIVGGKTVYTRNLSQPLS